MGPYLSQPNKEITMIQGSGNGFQFISAEMQGWRKNMQDACIHEVNLGDGNAIFGVFDGHGGHEVSKYVAQNFIKLLKQLKNYKEKKYTQALDEAFKHMDEQLKSQKGRVYLNTARNVDLSDPISRTTGCTANVVLITPTHIIVANAGDSRSVLCKEGKAIDLSIDHKPESQEEQTRIKKAGGVIYMGRVNGGLNLTRSFGDFDYKANNEMKYDEQMITCKPDIKQFKRDGDKDEYVIVGCDGIWQKYVQNSQGLIQIVNKMISKKQQKKVMMTNLLEQLIAKDTSQGIGCDNMTAIFIKLK